MTFFKKKIFTLFMALVLAVVCCAASVTGTYFAVTHSDQQKDVDLYTLAIKDSVFADDDEIMPLVEITKESELVTWNDTDNRVLLLTLNKYPDSYPPGEDITLSHGEVWTFTDKEFYAWYADNSGGVEDWLLRLHQLLGLPAQGDHTHITAMWVSPDDIIRPAYVTDITAQMDNEFDEDNMPDEQYIEWFDGNIIYSYFDSAYPWTRLGYTYDWADNGREYGMSEFIVEQGAAVEVEYTKTVDEFLTSIK